MFSLLTIGFLIGISHAFEADHLAAVTALVSGKSNRRNIFNQGMFWGAGHTITLFLIGGGAILAGATIPEHFSMGLELIVGLMLVALGTHVLYRLKRDRAHFHRHQHNDGTKHFHLHSHAGDNAAHNPGKHRHAHPDAKALRSLWVGMMHGVAGSAALILTTASQINSPFMAVIYILLFGAGSLLGMAAMTALVALPLSWTARSLTRANTVLQLGIGTLTIGFGVFIALGNTQALWG